MLIPSFGFFHRAKRSGIGQNKQTQSTAPNAGLEPLEDRLLLSGVTLIDPLSVDSYEKVIGEEGTYTFLMPEVLGGEVAPSVSGTVFQDDDGDGLRDPNEYRLEGVTLFADLDGDGKWTEGEKTATTGSNGNFHIEGLPTGEYDILALMPDGYKYSTSQGQAVSISFMSGVSGMQLGLARTGHDLTLRFSDVSMPESFKTGTRVRVPVILSNLGDTTINARNTTLRVYLSENATLSDEDIMVARIKQDVKLEPGESIKLNLEVDLPDSLASFRSYLIVDAKGFTLRSDISREDNTLASDHSLVFYSSNKTSTLQPEQIDIVLDNWATYVPYGGYSPGYGYDGYVGLDDLDIILGNWDSGYQPYHPEGQYYNAPVIGNIEVEGGVLTQGQVARISIDNVTDTTGSIERVMFFYDVDFDLIPDDLLGVDTDGSDGYAIEASQGASLTSYGDGRLMVVAMDSDGNLSAKSEFVESCLSVTVTAGQKLVCRDEAGRLYTVSLQGPGSVDVQLSGLGIEAWDVGNIIEVTGAVSIKNLLLEGTTGRSKLKIRTRANGNNGPAIVGGTIKGSTPMGVLDAVGYDLRGGVELTGNGVIRRIRASAIGDVSMEGDRFSNGVVIEAGEIAGDIDLCVPLRLLRAGKIHDADITAPSAGQVIVRGNYKRGQLTLTDGEVKESLALLQVGKILKAVDVNTASSIDTVRVGAMHECGILAAGESLFNTPASVLSSTAKRCYIKRLIVDTGAFSESYVAAWRIGQVRLELLGSDASSGPEGLYYRKLRSYSGPEAIQQTVV